MEQEIIHSATPLENTLIGVHPRLFITRDRIAQLRDCLKREPYASLFARVQRVADAAVGQANQPLSARGDTRGYGCATANLAMAWLLTGDRRYYDATIKYLEGMTTNQSWSHGLLFGHLALGYAVAFDWLYDTFDEATRRRYAECLFTHAQAEFDAIRTYADYHSFGYTCNTMPVMLAGLTAAGGALYGEVKGVAPWLRLVMEKSQLMVDSLGHDGMSPEGVGYGQYYAEFMAKMLTLVRDLIGIDLFDQSSWFETFGTALTYLAFPRKHWRKDAAFFMFGDSARSHWYGPDPHLRCFAAATRDGRGQWLADAVHHDNVGIDSAAYLNMIWHDPSVKPRSPRDLPTLRHFDDMEIVAMRSGWNGDESVMALKCGPAAGHHATLRTNHTACGGHMYPNAGGILLFAHGDLLISEAGYARKMSAYHNVALINGAGQLSEGGAWYEDLEFRKGHPPPFILHALAGTHRDYVVADATNAYPASTGLKRYLRHIIFLKPDTWVIVDEFETNAPGRFEILFHSLGPFAVMNEHTATATGSKGALLVTAIEPGCTTLLAEAQTAAGHDTGHPDHTLQMLRLSSVATTRRQHCITLFQAYPAGKKPPVKTWWNATPTGGRLTFKGAGAPAAIALKLKRKNWNTAII